MSIPQIHAAVANAISIFTLLVTLLALWKVIRRQGLGPDFWGAVIIGEGLILIQAIVGIILWIMGLPPGRQIHFLYGPLVALTWPAIWAYTRNLKPEREALWWMLGSAFLFFLSLRASSTGVPPVG